MGGRVKLLIHQRSVDCVGAGEASGPGYRYSIHRLQALQPSLEIYTLPDINLEGKYGVVVLRRCLDTVPLSLSLVDISWL